MRASVEPKTVEDYKDLTKILKLKIVKQSKLIQELEAKCKKYEADINNASFRLDSKEELNLLNTKTYDQIGVGELSTLKGKSAVMKKYLKGAKFFGITPESIYRVADFNYTNCIESDYFRTVLSKMALSLSPKEISSLIYIFDENCSGYISKDDYDNSLHAYEIGMEDNCLPYTQECLLRLCGLFHGQRVDLNKFYDDMNKDASSKKGSSGHVDLIVFEDHVKKAFPSKLQEREIIGAFNEINLEKQPSIDRRNFLYGVNSFINRLISDESRLKQNESQYPGSALKNSRSELRAGSSSTVTGNKAAMSAIANFSGSMGATSNEMANSGVTEVQLEGIFKEKNIRFEDIATELIKLPMKKRTSVHQFKRCIESTPYKLSLDEISEIFKQIDTGVEGSIHIHNLINFSAGVLKSAHVTFMFVGKMLQVSELNSQQFWGMYGLEEDRDVSKSKFLEVMAKHCRTKDQEAWSSVWEYFDRGKGVVAVSSIVKVWKGYELE